MYYSFYTKKQGIPIPLALLAVFILVFGLIRFFNQPKEYNVMHNKTEILETHIGNFSHNQVSLFWRTKDPVEGYIVYGDQPNDLNHKEYDELDTPTRLRARRNHLVILTDLLPHHTYYFMFINNGKTYSQSTGTAFTVETPRVITTTTQLPPVYGIAIDKKSNRAVDTIVILKIEGIEPLITRTKQDGSFLLSLCCLYRSASIEPLATLTEKQATLKILDDDGTATKVVADITDMTPFAQELVLGSNQPQALSSIADSELLQQSVEEVPLDPIDIIYPKQEADIPGNKPLMKGVALSGKTVKGVIQPEGETFEVETNGDGVWTYTPESALSAGKHTLAIQSKNENNQTLGKERSFIVLKSGEAVLGEATPSATLTPPRETPTSTATATPTLALSLTPTPPVTGFTILPFASIAAALVLFGLGLILVF